MDAEAAARELAAANAARAQAQAELQAARSKVRRSCGVADTLANRPPAFVLLQVLISDCGRKTHADKGACSARRLSHCRILSVRLVYCWSCA